MHHGGAVCDKDGRDLLARGLRSQTLSVRSRLGVRAASVRRAVHLSNCPRGPAREDRCRIIWRGLTWIS